MSTSLVRRILVAAIAIPIAVGIIYLGGWVLVAGLMVLGVVGAAEFYRLAEARGIRPVRGIGYAGAALLPVTVLLLTHGQLSPRWASLGAAVWVMTTVGLATRLRCPQDAPLEGVAVTLFGAVYASGLLGFLLALRHGARELAPLGATALVLFPLIMTWICDTLAMAGGALIGGVKLAPVASPNKTWAGAVAGVIGAIGVAIAYGSWVLPPLGVRLTAVQLLLLGLSVGIFGQIGDLGESLFKRSAGVKDSGTFFPGHGGVLDRLDSLYWVIPISVLWLAAFGVV